MKIAILYPKADFSPEQQANLAEAGEVVYMELPLERPVDELSKLAEGADILAIDPDSLGGFEKGKENLTQLLGNLPTVKGLAIDTTSYGWVDTDYCKKRNIPVSNCPGWSKEAVAEHALALLFCLAKKIIKLDRKTQNGAYALEMGFELKGKTLGIIGVGSIGSTLATLAKGIGMRVIGYNHSPKTVEGVEMKNSLDELLAESDAISLHITHTEANINMIGEEQIKKMKDGVIIVNLTNRESINEEAMAQALKSGRIFGYAYEAEDMINTPLVDVENAIALKGFGWYTKEAVANLFQVWTGNIVAFAEGSPRNVVN